MDLYLIRHGQSIENTQPWDGRNYNSPLTELGLAQAEAVGKWIGENISLDVLYASPMQRTHQTAAAIQTYTGIEPIFDDRIREVGNARPDGSPFDLDNLPLYFAKIWGSLHPYNAITENGENWMHFRARIGGFIEWLIQEMPDDHTDYDVGVVCHGGVIEGVFEHVFQKGPVSPLIVHSHNTSITQFRYQPIENRPPWGLISHNKTEHLSQKLLSY